MQFNSHDFGIKDSHICPQNRLEVYLFKLYTSKAVSLIAIIVGPEKLSLWQVTSINNPYIGGGNSLSSGDREEVRKS